MTRWIARDSILLYTLHRYTWQADGGKLTAPRTSEIRASSARLYQIEFATDSLGVLRPVKKRLLQEVHRAVPCLALAYDTGQQRILFSYLPRDMARPRDCRVDGGDPSRRVVVGTYVDSIYFPMAEVQDTAALLSRLGASDAFTHAIYVGYGSVLCPQSTEICFDP